MIILDKHFRNCKKTSSLNPKEKEIREEILHKMIQKLIFFFFNPLTRRNRNRFNATSQGNLMYVRLTLFFEVSYHV